MIIIIGFVAIYSLYKIGVSDGYIIACAILMAAWAIVDKLWDVKIGLTEIKNTIKH